MDEVTTGLTPMQQERRTSFQALEAAIRKYCPNPTKFAQEDLPVKETLINGLYVRQLSIPANSIVIGKIHRHANITSVNKGMALVTSEKTKPRIVKAGDQFEVPAFNYNVVFAVTDVVWTTSHPVTATSLEQIEAELIIPSLEQLDEEVAQLEHKGEHLCHSLT